MNYNDYEDRGELIIGDEPPEPESLWPDEWIKELIVKPEEEILPEELFEI